MIFCGQCGLQLAPGSTRCPRCGTAVEPTEATIDEPLHTDDATVASPSFIAHSQPKSSAQQPLVLRPGDNNYNPGTQAPEYEATSMVEAPNYGTRAPNAGASYPGYPQPGGTYPTQQVGSYPDYGPQFTGAGNYPQQMQGASYTGMTPQMGAGYQQQQQYAAQQQAASRSKGRIAAMVVIFVGLMFILAAVILFIVQQQTGGSQASLIMEHYLSYNRLMPSLYNRFYL